MTRKEKNIAFFNNERANTTELTLRLVADKTFTYHDRTGQEKVGVNYIGVDAEGNCYFCNCFGTRIYSNGQYAKARQYVTIIAEITGSHVYIDEEQIDITLIDTLSIKNELDFK